MTELLPCPFCGGEAKIRGNSALFVQCGNCGTRYGDRYHTTEAEAIAAWNTRAERTCHIVGEEYDDLLEYTSVEFSCGHYAIGLPSYFDYCPKCGAKVVEE